MNLFDIKNNQVIVNENVLLIPEIKAVYDKYGLNALAYIHYITFTGSPYMNIPEENRSEVIYKDFPGEYSTEDFEIVVCVEKINKQFYNSPVLRYYQAQSIALDNISNYLKDTIIDDDPKEGNSATYARFAKEGKLVLKALLEAEEAKDKEELKARGNQKRAYDD